jgi:hypothetical protein
MAFEIAGHVAKFSQEINVGQIGSNDGGNGSMRDPSFGGGSRYRNSYKSVGGVEH